MTAIELLATSGKDFNEINYSDHSNPRNFSRYIKASANIRRHLINQSELNLALVFPNSQNIVNEFLVYEILRAINSNEIQANYNLDNFSTGEKVSVGKASLIYIGKSDDRVFLQCSDVDKVSIPIKYAPILQKSKSKQLSSVKLFDKERKRLSSSIGLLSALASNKTHMDKTIVFINLDSSMADIIEGLSTIHLNEHSIKDLLYITKLVNGKPENVFSTRDSGISPLLCASDFVDLLNSEVHNHVHSIIIKYSKRLENNIPFIQSLLELRIPVTIIMDSKDYIESSILSSFKAWIWDKDSILSLSSYGDARNYRYINNCANQQIKYEIVNDVLVDECFISITRAFGAIKKDIESFDGYSFAINLYQMVLNIVRSPYYNFLNEAARSDELLRLQSIDNEIEERENFLDPSCYTDFKTVINNLTKIYKNQEYSFPKGLKLYNILSDLVETQKDIYLIIPDNIDRNACSQYTYRINNNVSVLRASEFLEIDASNAICIIVGWLPRKQMLHLLYSYNTQHIIVLLYSSENYKWKEQTRKNWKRKFSSPNRLQIRTGNDGISLSVSDNQDDNQADYDEEESFRKTVLLSRHRKYREQDNGTDRNITVDASSIEFLGNQFMFVTDKHKMLIVDSSLSKVHSYQIKDVKEGDFLVFRKSSKDIIREEADRILISNGFDSAREIASEWKPLLENLFWEYSRKYTLLFEDLKGKGCSVMIQTFRMWVNEPDMIMMDSINDLESIIKLSSVKPVHSTKEIFECGKLVREAHKEAGKTISEKLRLFLMRNKPKGFFNSSIDMDVPDVGAISLMKINSVSHEKETVETKYVHRLLS